MQNKVPIWLKTNKEYKKLKNKRNFLKCEGRFIVLRKDDPRNDDLLHIIIYVLDFH